MSKNLELTQTWQNKPKIFNNLKCKLINLARYKKSITHNLKFFRKRFLSSITISF